MDREHYLHLDKIYKKHLYHKKKAHITNILDKSKNKSGALYKILRSFAKPKDNNPLPDINKEKLPDEFANYFLNKIEKIMDAFEGNDKYSPPIRPCTKLQKCKPLTEQQALNVINQMHYTTCEMDPHNTKFLMKFKDTLIGTITKIINMSLTTGQYLDEWKVAVVRPLIKGPNLDMEYKNYCPISNLSFMAKLIEKAVQIQLMAHFTEHNLLAKHQNAYRKYFSTETVHIDSFSSNTKTINFSVPQGSILGPTLFNCYVSTLMEIIPENDENFVSGYADDHALINTFHPEDTDISSKLVTNISYIKDWMNRNQLKMNDAKTEFTVFGSKHQVQRNDLKSLNIDNTTIRAKLVIKFLGAYLDESLNMKTRIANRTKNALYNLYLIKNIRKYITQETAKMLLCSLVLSQLDYLNLVLTDLPKATLRLYNYTQRYAARLACNKIKRDSAQDCMKILHWLVIEFRTKFKLLTIVFKTLQGNGPSYLQRKLKSMTYHRTTRISTTKDITLKVPFNKKKTWGDHGFSHTAATHWNKLPEYIRQTEDISIFRRLLKTHYFRLAYKT